MMLKNILDLEKVYKALWQVPVISILSIIIALTCNFVRSERLPLIGEWSVEARFSDNKGESLVISLNDARKLFEENACVFVDARNVSDYENGHIKNAINVPWHNVEDYFSKFIEKVELDKLLITYCDGENCDLSHELALFLIDAGYKNVKILINGWTVWSENKLPVEGLK
ncbi:MAG: rhodanese-like domain-containing protein [Desulfobacterales bacterium]|nr:rhodanese-like domain-containing protein [Desulfobacterales bacterium]